jgi:hypothetical protein
MSLRRCPLSLNCIKTAVSIYHFREEVNLKIAKALGWQKEPAARILNEGKVGHFEGNFKSSNSRSWFPRLER